MRIYSRKQEIEKQKAMLRAETEDNNNIAQRIADGKIMEIDHWITFMIDVKHGKVDLSKTKTQRQRNSIMVMSYY